MLLDAIKRAFSQMISNRYTTVSAVGIISIILLVFGMFLLSFYNLNIFAETLKSDMQVIAYIDNNLSLERLQTIKGEIEGFREVEKVTYISKDYALEMLSRDKTSIREMVKELKGNPLPDSFRISLTGNSMTPEGIKALVEKLKGVREIDDIEYGEEWVERLNVLISTARIIGAVVGGVLILVVLFTVSNTIKFTLLTRREEIEVMKFAGATNLFIKIPFIIEGGVLGLISAISSVLMLFFTYKIILYKIPPAAYVWLGGIEFTFIPYGAIAFLIGIGIILGCFGSWVSVGRYLRVAIFLFLCLNINNVTFAKVKDVKGIEGQSIEKEIEESQKRLENINKQIREKKRASKQAAVEEKKVKKNIEVKEKNLSSKKKDLKRANTNIVEKEREIDRAQGDIDTLAADITKKKREMADFLRYVYKSHIGRQRGLAGILLASNDYNDFIMRSKYEDRLIGEANRLIKGLGKEVDDLQGQLLLLNKRRYTLLTEKDKLLRDKSMIEQDVRKNRVKLTSIQERRGEYEKELKKLANASMALKNLIESYEKRSSQLASIDTGFGKEKGRLMWPLAGDVVSKFGRQKHPEFDAYIYKKGIEIASNTGREVRVVYDGVVAYADLLKGYGLIAIIDHGNSYYSIYAHASRLLVSKGNRVRKGQAIAIAGNGSGNLSEREGIYFEIRHNGQPVDPLAWLGSGRG